MSLKLHRNCGSPHRYDNNNLRRCGGCSITSVVVFCIQRRPKPFFCLVAGLLLTVMGTCHPPLRWAVEKMTFEAVMTTSGAAGMICAIAGMTFGLAAAAAAAIRLGCWRSSTTSEHRYRFILFRVCDCVRFSHGQCAVSVRRLSCAPTLHPALRPHLSCDPLSLSSSFHYHLLPASPWM